MKVTRLECYGQVYLTPYVMVTHDRALYGDLEIVFGWWNFQVAFGW